MLILRWLQRIRRNPLIALLIAVIIFGNAFFMVQMSEQKERDEVQLEELVARARQHRDTSNDRNNKLAKMVQAFERVDESEIQKNLTLRMKKLKQENGDRHNKFTAAWKIAEQSITSSVLYENDEDVEIILRALHMAPIVKVDVFGTEESYSTGTSHKWLLTLDGGQLAVFKLMWETKGEQKPNGSCNSGFEMPSSEIAAFQLHRLFGLYNTPYVSGRKIDVGSEIIPVATDAVKEQIRQVGATEYCITGSCFHCQKHEDLCVPSGQVEGAVIYWLPKPLKLHTLPPLYHPFATTNMKEWQEYKLNDNAYCLNIPQKYPFYKHSKKYLDIFDFALMDYIMHHFDSKHYTIDEGKVKETGLTVRLDFGRAFCYYDEDRDDILLAPLRQCCTIRRSTWGRMMSLQKGMLTKEMTRKMRWDPLNPVLKDQFYEAMTRRLRKVAVVIHDCAKIKGGISNVVVNDY